jgi:hypothetical protein
MRRLMPVVALIVASSLFTTGCMISRAVDRAFLGISVRRPAYQDRKTTGVFLLPFTFAIDIATFPIQALLVVILGDQFPFSERDELDQVLSSAEFKQLDAQKQALATAEFKALLEQGAITPDTAMALGEDGHWTLVTLSDEQRSQFIARALAPQAAPVAVAACMP